MSAAACVVLGAAAQIIAITDRVALVPFPLIVTSVVVGMLTWWEAGRLLARNAFFSELLGIFGATFLTLVFWVVSGAAITLVPREISVRNGQYNSTLAGGERLPEEGKPQRVAIYARVSSHEQQANLDRQADRLVAYCAAKGYQVQKVVKEIASGVNDSRPKLLALLEDHSITLMVVEHQDRLTRFGFRYLDTLLRGQGRALEVVNEAENETEDLVADLTSIIYSCCARLYGQRRAKRKTEAVVRQLEAGEAEDATG